MLWLCALPPTSDPKGGNCPGLGEPAQRVLWLHARPLPAKACLPSGGGRLARGCSEWRWEECDAMHGTQEGRGLC